MNGSLLVERRKPFANGDYECCFSASPRFRAEPLMDLSRIVIDEYGDISWEELGKHYGFESVIENLIVELEEDGKTLYFHDLWSELDGDYYEIDHSEWWNIDEIIYD